MGVFGFSDYFQNICLAGWQFIQEANNKSGVSLLDNRVKTKQCFVYFIGLTKKMLMCPKWNQKRNSQNILQRLWSVKYERGNLQLCVYLYNSHPSLPQLSMAVHAPFVCRTWIWKENFTSIYFCLCIFAILYNKDLLTKEFLYF